MSISNCSRLSKTLRVLLAAVLAVSLCPMPSYADEAATASVASVADAPQETAVPIPEGESLTYNGDWQLGIEPSEGWSFACADGIEGHFDAHEGCRKADAGEYECVLRLDEGYAWEDGSHDDAVVAWSIAPRAVAVPAGSELEWTGEPQQGVPAGEGYELSGDVEAVEPGEYAVTATLLPSFVWEDGASDPREIAWSIVEDDQYVEYLANSQSDETAFTFPSDDGSDVGVMGEAAAKSGALIPIPSGGTFVWGSPELAAWQDANVISYYAMFGESAFSISVSSDGGQFPPRGLGALGPSAIGSHTLTYALSSGFRWEDGTTSAKKVRVDVTGGDLSTCSVSLAKDAYTDYYAGRPVRPDFDVISSKRVESIQMNFPLVLGRDYVVSYRDNVYPGTATATLTGIGHFSGTVEVPFEVGRADLADADVVLSKSSYVADGTPCEPLVSVKYFGAQLTEGVDYELSYSGNVKAGTAKAIVTGIGNYRGSASAKFTISAKSISGATVTLSKSSYVANGTYRKPSVTVKLGGKALVMGTDYTVSYSNNKAPGIAKVTVRGIGIYKGTVTKSFSIYTAKAGWFQSGGYWYYSTGSGLASGWKTINGARYYFDAANKRMSTGLKLIDGKRYYFASSGAMVKSAWQKVGASWYYLTSTGAAKTGWLTQGSTTYRFHATSGKMLTGLWKIDGKRYYFASSGAMTKSGWVKSGGYWYYMTSTGPAKSGWLTLGGNRYYFNTSNNRMVTGLKVISGKSYSFASSGVMEKSCWRKYGDHWYCFSSTGAPRTGWVTSGSDKYWFDSTGKGASWEGRMINGEYAFFNIDGTLQKKVSGDTRGWVRVRTPKYYSNGAYCYYHDWMYYIDSRGRILGTNGDHLDSHRIGSYDYCFSEQGWAMLRKDVSTGKVYSWEHIDCSYSYGCQGREWTLA